MNLPTWTREERTQTMREELPGGALGDEYTETVVVYRCGDPTEEIFRQKCAVYGFSLPQFDTWLQALEPCGARDQLLVLRARAKGRNQALSEAISNARFMWRAIVRDENLLEEARRVRGRPSNGGKKAAEAKQQARDERKAAAVAQFRKLWWPGSNVDRAEVLAAMVRSKRFGGESTVRDYLKDELRRARGKAVK